MRSTALRTDGSRDAATGPFTTATVVDHRGLMFTASGAVRVTSMCRGLVMVEVDDHG